MALPRLVPVHFLPEIYDEVSHRCQVLVVRQLGHRDRRHGQGLE